MINIDDDDFEEETLEDRIFEKADYIGDILTGKRKIKLTLPKKPVKPKIIKSKKPSRISIIVNDFKLSINKYKTMPLSRLIGLGIILLLAILIVAIVAYLLLSLMTTLLQLGILGFIIFAIFICVLCSSGILLLASRYTRK
jgi:hypothetical protein